MGDAPLTLLAAYASAALCAFWIVTANLAALARYRAGLDGRKASFASRFAWTLSVIAAWTGPLVVLGAILAIWVGARESGRVKRGEITRRSRLPAEMAVKNGVVLLVGAVLVVTFIWLAWRPEEGAR